LLEFLKIGGSAFLGMLAAFGVQWIKSGRDELRLICDDFCKVAGDAADLSSGYWLKAGDYDDIKLLEARILGYQSRLTGLRVLTSEWFKPTDTVKVDSALADLFDALSGGDFSVSGRAPDQIRCNLAQVHAANLMIEVRRAYARSVTVGGLYGRWTTRPRRAARTAGAIMLRHRSTLGQRIARIRQRHVNS